MSIVLTLSLGIAILLISSGKASAKGKFLFIWKHFNSFQ